MKLIISGVIVFWLIAIMGSFLKTNNCQVHTTKIIESPASYGDWIGPRHDNLLKVPNLEVPVYSTVGN